MRKCFPLILLYILLCKMAYNQVGSYASAYSGCLPLTVQFYDTSKGSPSCYYWNFANDSTSSLADPVVTFTGSGTYHVLHIVCLGNVRDSQYTEIKVYQSPVASITTNPTISCFEPRIVDFTASSTTPNGPVTYEWNFDTAGATSPLQNPTFVYYVGNYIPYVVVTDTLGCADTVYSHVFITTDDISANYSASVDSASCPPLAVDFTNLSTGDFLYSAWLFGDGDSSYTYNTSHTYYFPGDYTVSLIVYDTFGCVGLIFDLQIYIGGPTAQFSVTPDSGCAPLAVSITGSASPTLSINADLGDGTVLQDTIDVTHTYSIPGLYYPIYNLTDSFGCAVAYPIDTIVVSGICDTSTGLVNLPGVVRFRLFPDPVNDILNINYEGEESATGDMTLEIFNSLGQLMLTRKMMPEAAAQKIDVSKLPDGPYIILLKESPGIVAVSRFIKE